MPLGHMALNTTAYGLTVSVGAGNASGIALPTASITGWAFSMSEDFGTSFSAGGVNSSGVFPSPYVNEMYAYADGTNDTSANNNGSNSKYYPSTNLSCGASKLITKCDLSGTLIRSATYVITPASNPTGQLSGRFEICFRVPSSIHGFKTAYLLWPTSGVWPRDSEIDWPEGSLATGGGGFGANHLHQGSVSGVATDFDHHRYGTVPIPDGNWHVATIEWLSGSFVRSLWDGVTVGTTYDRVPNTAMRWTIQVESDVDLFGTGGYATTGDNGTVEVDWLAIWTASSPAVPGTGLAPSSTNLLTELFTGTNGASISATNWTSTTTSSGATAQIQTNKGRFTTGTLGGYADNIVRLSTTNQPSDCIIAATLGIRTLSENYPYVTFNDTGTGATGWRLYFYPSSSQFGLSDNHGQDNVFNVNSSGWSTSTSLKIEIIIQSGLATFRVWNAAGSRPTDPQAQTNVSGFTGTKCGLGLIGGNAASSVSCDWDDFSIASVVTPFKYSDSTSVLYSDTAGMGYTS